MVGQSNQDTQIRLKSEFVSNKHASIFMKEGKFKIKGEKSTHGTQVKVVEGQVTIVEFPNFTVKFWRSDTGKSELPKEDPKLKTELTFEQQEAPRKLMLKQKIALDKLKKKSDEEYEQMLSDFKQKLHLEKKEETKKREKKLFLKQKIAFDNFKRK